MSDPCPECGAYTTYPCGVRVDTVNLLHSPAECKACNAKLRGVASKLWDRLLVSMERELFKEFSRE